MSKVDRLAILCDMGYEEAVIFENPEYNSIRALPYAGEDAPIIMNKLHIPEEK